MSDDLVNRAAALVEKQKAWDKWDNPRQPAPPAMVEGEVATLVSDMAAEITRLRAALATVRREGMEEAAKALIEKYQSMTIHPNTPEAWRLSILQDLREMAGEKPNTITAADIDAAASRAAAKEGKP